MYCLLGDTDAPGVAKLVVWKMPVLVPGACNTPDCQSADPVMCCVTRSH